jgi:precorrin-6B methylase 2
MNQLAEKQISSKADLLVDPGKIMQVGMGFWASKTLLTAVNMGLFTFISENGKKGTEIIAELGLHERSAYDFLDTLVALGFLEKNGLKETATYSNSADTNLFLDKNKPSYIGGLLEMANHRLYPFWGNLEEGLKTGLPQNEAKDGGKPLFEELYADESRLKEFIQAMTGAQMGNFITFSRNFNFSEYNTMCDIGGSGASLSAQVALNNDNMSCISFDLPPVAPIAQENIDGMQLGDRVSIQSGDFFQDSMPQADVITMGNILHDWGLEEKKQLIKKAYDALPKGGALVVIENIIDDNREKNAFGLMMSLNMLIETDSGFDYSFAEFNEWAKEAGFQETSIMLLTGPSSAAIAIK